MRRLAIYCKNDFVGILSETAPGRGYVFQYDVEYLKQSNSASVSLTLPLQEAPFFSDTLFPFFSNLLPEGLNRKLICRQNKIDENDDFGILNLFDGKDFIGAISVKKI